MGLMQIQFKEVTFECNASHEELGACLKKVSWVRTKNYQSTLKGT
jgi:hypothetical protein